MPSLIQTCASSAGMLPWSQQHLLTQHFLSHLVQTAEKRQIGAKSRIAQYASFEAVVVAIKHSGHRSHFIWKKTQIQLGIALLHHAA